MVLTLDESLAESGAWSRRVCLAYILPSCLQVS